MNFCTLILGLLMTLLMYEDLCGVNANHLSGNSNRTLARSGAIGRLGTARRNDGLATSRRTVGADTRRRAEELATSRRTIGAETRRRTDGLATSRRTVGAETRRRTDGLATSRRTAGADTLRRTDGLATSRRTVGADTRRRAEELATSRRTVGADTRRRAEELATSRRTVGADTRRRAEELATSRRTVGADTRRRAEELATSRRTAGAESLRRTASGRVITSRRNGGTTNTRGGAANTRFGISNTRVGTNTRVETTNPRVGTANTRVGTNTRVATNTGVESTNTRAGTVNTRFGTNTRVGIADARARTANTRVGTNTREETANTRLGTANTRAESANTLDGVSNTRGRGSPGTSANSMDNARVILTPVQQGAVRSMRNLLQNGRSATGRGSSNPRLIGFLIPRADGRTQLQLMPDARRFLGGDTRRRNGRVRPQTQRNNTLPLNLRTIINAARRANLLPGRQSSRGGTRNPAVAGEQSIVVLRPREGETGGLLQAPDNLRSSSVRNQILEERRNALRQDNRIGVDRRDRLTTNRPLDRNPRTRSRQDVASQATNRIDQANRRTGVDQSGSSRRTIAVARDRNPLSSGVDQFTNPGQDPNQFVPNNTPDPRANNALVDTATPPLQDRTLFLPSSVNNINGIDPQITPAPLDINDPLNINIDPLQQVFPARVNEQTTAPQSPIQTNGGSTSTVFEAAAGTQSLPQTFDRNANIQTVDPIVTDSQTASTRFAPSPVTGTSANMQTNIPTDMPPIQAQSTNSIQTGFGTPGIQTNMQNALTPQPVFDTPASIQTASTQTLAQIPSAQPTVFDSSTSMQTTNNMLPGLPSTSVFDTPTSVQTGTTQILAQTPSTQQTKITSSAGIQTNNMMQTDLTPRPTSTQTGMSQTLFENPQTSQASVAATTGTGISPTQANTIDMFPQSGQPSNNMVFPPDAGNVIDSTMLLPPPILPVSSVSANVNSQVDQNIVGQIDQSMFNSVKTGSVASNINDVMPNLPASTQQASNTFNTQLDQSQLVNTATVGNNQFAVNNQPNIPSQSVNNGAVNNFVTSETQANMLTSVTDQGALQRQIDTLPPIQNNANLGQFTSSVINNVIDSMQTQQGQQLVNTQAQSPNVGKIVGLNGSNGQVNVQTPILNQDVMQGQGMIQNGITSQTSVPNSVQNTIQGQANMRNPNLITIEIAGQTKQGGITGQTGIQNVDIANMPNAVQSNIQDTNILKDPLTARTYVSAPGTITERNSNITINQLPVQPNIKQNIISSVNSNINTPMSSSVLGGSTFINSNNTLTGNIMTANINTAPGTITNITSTPTQQSLAETNTQNAINNLSADLQQALANAVSGGQNTLQNTNLLPNTISSQTFIQNPATSTNTGITSNKPTGLLPVETSIHNAVGNTNLNVNQGLATSVASTISDTIAPVQPAQSVPSVDLSRVETTNLPAINPPPLIFPTITNINAKPTIGISNITREIYAVTGINSLPTPQGQVPSVAPVDVQASSNLMAAGINSLPPQGQVPSVAQIGVQATSSVIATGINSLPPQGQVPNLAPVAVQTASNVMSNNATTIQNSIPFIPPAPNVPILKTTSEVLNLNTVSVGNSTSPGNRTLLTNTINAVPPTIPSQSLANSVSIPEVAGLPVNVASALPDIIVSANAGNTAGTQVIQQPAITEITKPVAEQAATAFKTASNITNVAMPTAIVKALIQTTLNTSELIGNLNRISNSSNITEVLSSARGIVDSALAAGTDPTLGKALTNAAQNGTQNVVMGISTLKTLISEVLSEFFSHQFNPAKTALTPTAVINTVAQAVADSRKFASPSASNSSASGAIPGPEPVQAIFTTSPQVPEIPKDSKIDFPPPPPFAGMTESINIPKTDIVDIRPSNAMENAFLSRSANTAPINPVLIGEPSFNNISSPGEANITNNVTNNLTSNISSPILPVPTGISNNKTDTNVTGIQQINGTANTIANDQNIFSSTIIKTPNIDSLRGITESSVVFDKGFQHSGILQPSTSSNGGNFAIQGTISDISTRLSVAPRTRTQPIPSLTNVPLVNDKLSTVSDRQANRVDPQTGFSGLASTIDFNSGNIQKVIDNQAITPSLSDISTGRSVDSRTRTQPIPSLTNVNNQPPLVNDKLSTVLDRQSNRVNPQTGLNGLASTIDFNSGKIQKVIDNQAMTPSMRQTEFDTMRSQLVRSRINGADKVTADASYLLANIPDNFLSSFKNDFTSLSPLLGVTKATPRVYNGVRASDINTQTSTSAFSSPSSLSNFQGTTSQFSGSKMTTPHSRMSTRRPLRTTTNALSAEKTNVFVVGGGGIGGGRQTTARFFDAGGVSVSPSTPNMPLFRSTFFGSRVTKTPLFSSTRVSRPRMINNGVTRNVRTSSASSQRSSTSTVTQSSTSTQGVPSFGFDPSASFGLLGLPPPPPSNLMEMNATALISDTAISSSQLSLMNVDASTSVRTNRPMLSTVPPSVTVDPLVRFSTIQRSSPALTSLVNFNTPLV